MDAWLWAITVLLTLWLYSAVMSRSFPTLQNKRILLLIAHPDDEAMFFAPTVQRLTSASLNNQLKILCLSSGNADGLGAVRAKELHRSVHHLGLTPADVILLDDPQLQDGPAAWNAQYISRTLMSNLAPQLAKTPVSKPPTAAIDVLITFDEGGVSAHPNHVSCYQGALLFLSDLMRGREGWESPVAVYALRSVSLYRKYAHAVDAGLTVVLCIWRALIERRKRLSGKAVSKTATDGPNVLFLVSGPQNWWRGLRAMVSGHWSQMVWFRWGWICFGRYMLVNDLRKLKPS